MKNSTEEGGGGAIEVSHGVFDIANSTFSENIADSSGGALKMDEGRRSHYFPRHLCKESDSSTSGQGDQQYWRAIAPAQQHHPPAAEAAKIASAPGNTLAT